MTLPTTVLVVDDEPGIRRTLARALARQGYEVLVASTGEEAAEILGEHDVAAVLMDLRMPSMSGRTLFHLIKSQWPDLVPRVAVMSGDPESEDHEEWLSVHQLPRIPKPFDLPSVLSLVAELASGDERTANGP